MRDDLARLREQVAQLRSTADEALREGADSPLRMLLETISDQALALADEIQRLYESAVVTTNGFFGIYRGTVVDTTDPLARGRLRVVAPEVTGLAPVWALPCLPGGAGPPIANSGDRVWVMFEGGEPSRPVVLGTFPA